MGTGGVEPNISMEDPHAENGWQNKRKPQSNPSMPRCLGKTFSRDGLSTGDAAYTARVAHSLKGAIGYFGVQRASALAAQLETLGRQAALEDAAFILQQLEQEWARISAFVDESGWAERL